MFNKLAPHLNNTDTFGQSANINSFYSAELPILNLSNLGGHFK